jgi:transcriptional regulator
MSFENFARLVQKKMKESKKNGIKVPYDYTALKSSSKNQSQQSTPKKGCCGKRP